MALEVSFVRHRARRDRVHVMRPDGSSTAWDFPSYGDNLPHDLCHLVVEEGLGIVNGFWGLVDQGVDVKLVHNEATLVRDGSPLVEHAGIDFSDLTRAEEAVAVFGPTGPDLGYDLPPGTSEEAVASVRRHLDELAEQWRCLDDGGAITIRYCGRPQ